jgi:hypothetical protein
MRDSDSGDEKSAAGTPKTGAGIAHDQSTKFKPLGLISKDPESMKLIPWEDIWTSLRVAQIRGNGEMIDVFYDTLFKEAIFDDDGAWAFTPKKRF